MYLVSEFRILMPLSMLSLMYGRYTKPPSWRNLAKRPTLQRGSRDAAECADAGCTGATGTRGYGGCAGAAVLGCGRSVPLKTAVESSPWTERGAPKSALTHQKQTPFSSLKKKIKHGVAACRGGAGKTTCSRLRAHLQGSVDSDSSYFNRAHSTLNHIE